MNKTFLGLLLLSNLYAYEKGDTISNGIALHIGATQEKLYIVDFFASWCGSCKKEIPLISKVNKHIDKNRVEIIGIDVDKRVQNGIKFQTKLKENNNLNFRVINDPQNLVISEFSPIGMPTLYYIKNRKIVKIITGAVDDIDKVLLQDIKELE
jgi:thiol-disulfide isomerase/thioredoxin